MSTLRSLLLQARDVVEGYAFPTVTGGDPAGGTLLALTFDDGPTPGVTDRIGSLLAQRGHGATFFVLVPQAVRHPDIIQTLVAQGHEIALHGLRHERLTDQSPAQIRADLTWAKRHLQALGVPTVRFLRPPFGAQTRMTYAMSRRAGLTPVTWSVDIQDYGAQALSDVTGALDRGLRTGEIVLLHDGDGDRPEGVLSPAQSALKLEIVERAIALLDERGVRSVPVSALMEAGARTGRWVHGADAPWTPHPASAPLRPPGADDGVSAVIAHYGDPSLANTLVDDLLAQRDAHAQVIVSDDASPRPFPARDGVTVVRSPTNGGFGSAINRGAAVATEPWLLVLNSDVRLPPDFLSRACQKAAEWQPAICGFPQQGEAGWQPASGRFPTLHSSAAVYTRTLAPLVARQGWSIWSLPDPVADGPVDWLVASALLVPRTLFEAAGGFDERFFMYLEEVDLQRRLQLADVASVYLTGPTFSHAPGTSSDSLDVPVELLRSRLLYMGKWEGPARLRILEGLMYAGIAVDLAADMARLVRGGNVHPLAHAQLQWSRLAEARRARVRGAAPRSRTTG